MKHRFSVLRTSISMTVCCLMVLIWGMHPFHQPSAIASPGMDEVKARGELRHLGIPYANFVTGAGDGFSVDMMRHFADYLGVKYVFVESSFSNIIPDLTGKRRTTDAAGKATVTETPIKGDVISTGFTVLPWREELVAFATPSFPNQIWLMTAAGSDLMPITPSGNIDQDIAQVKGMIKGRKVLGKNGTCVDPSLYKLAETGAAIIDFPDSLNDLIPAVMKGDAEATILDVPDALVAMAKWPGQIKVIGPISPEQRMAEAFRKEDTGLREAFEAFLIQIKADGTFMKLIQTYYPDVTYYFSKFFEDCAQPKE